MAEKIYIADKPTLDIVNTKVSVIKENTDIIGNEILNLKSNKLLSTISKNGKHGNNSNNLIVDVSGRGKLLSAVLQTHKMNAESADLKITIDGIIFWGYVNSKGKYTGVSSSSLVKYDSAIKGYLPFLTNPDFYKDIIIEKFVGIPGNSSRQLDMFSILGEGISFENTLKIEVLSSGASTTTNCYYSILAEVYE